MIKIDYKNAVYTCPFCEHDQASWNSDIFFSIDEVGFYKTKITEIDVFQPKIPPEHLDTEMKIYSLKCSNIKCGKTCVVAVNKTTGKQIDIFHKLLLNIIQIIFLLQ